MKPKSGTATGGSQKTVLKKSSDTSSKFPPNARKSSQITGKKEGAAIKVWSMLSSLTLHKYKLHSCSSKLKNVS